MPAGDPGSVAGGLSVRARSGVLWLVAINAITKGSQMVVTLALAAIFTESDLGLVTLAMALVNAAMVIQVMGASHVVSRTEQDEHVMAGTVLTLSLLPSLALTAAGILGSAPIAAALGAPAAAPLIATVAIGLPFMSIAWLQMALMNRDLDFRRRLLPDVGSAVAGAVTTVGLALAGVGPISVAIGFVLTAVLQPCFGFLVGVRVRPRWDTGAAAEARGWIINVGLGAVVYTVLLNVDFPIVSRILGPDALGLYSLAFRIGWLPYLLVSVVLASVAFPVYAKLIRDGRQDRLSSAVARFTQVLVPVIGGMYAIVFLMADRVVLLGQRWEPATSALMVLCAYGFGLSLLTLWYETIIVSGRLRRYLVFEVCHLALLVVLLLTVTRYGITSAAWAQVAAVWTLVVCVWLTLRRAKITPSVGVLARAGLGFLLPAGFCGVLVLVARRAGIEPDPTSIVGTLVEFLVLVTGYTVVAALANRSVVASLRMRGKAARQ